MTSAATLRDPFVVKEELNDLVNYLSGLPEGLRYSDAFAAYEQRVGELSRELILSDTFRFIENIPSGRVRVEGTATYLYSEALEKGLSDLARRYQRGAEQSLNASRFLHWSVLFAATGSLISAVTLPISLVAPFTAIATLTAAIDSFFRFRDTARERQQFADHLNALRLEISHSFGPRGEVLSPSEYYPASTKRIEQMLDELRHQLPTK